MRGANGYVELLGMKTFNFAALVREVERGFPYRSYERLRRSLGTTEDDLLRLVGISRRTLTRRKEEGRFSSEESDRLLRAARVFARSVDLFDGDRRAALHWLSESQTALGGAIPLVLARTEVGAREVEALTLRLEHGVFS
jgi:putative toxin-antitoxin system antitoxin component (TIGR02293 family)